MLLQKSPDIFCGAMYWFPQARPFLDESAWGNDKRASNVNVYPRSVICLWIQRICSAKTLRLDPSRIYVVADAQTGGYNVPWSWFWATRILLLHGYIQALCFHNEFVMHAQNSNQRMCRWWFVIKMNGVTKGPERDGMYLKVDPSDGKQKQTNVHF